MNVTSHITRHHITYDGRLRHIWGTSSTTGGNNSRHICRDARFLAHRSTTGAAADGPEQTRLAPLTAVGATLDSPVYTLITF